MTIEKLLKRSIAVTLLSIIPLISWATPLTFEFTGRISDTVLISRTYQTLFTNHPEWNGQTVTGVLKMDLPEQAASPFNGPGYTQYGASMDYYPHADWISFIINNPDGTVLDISNSVPVVPAPEAEGDDAYTHLAHLSYLNGESSFYSQRSYTNSETYPQKRASLWLSAYGENADWLTSSANYNDVIIRPEYANDFNYGYVYDYTASGAGHEYAFTITSLELVKSNVSEPSSILLFFSGILLILLRAVNRTPTA